MTLQNTTASGQPVWDVSLPGSDSAGFISKGKREPVVGYKPQLARSRSGFVVGLQLPKGNAPDSQQLVPMIDEVIARTA